MGTFCVTWAHKVYKLLVCGFRLPDAQVHALNFIGSGTILFSVSKDRREGAGGRRDVQDTRKLASSDGGGGLNRSAVQDYHRMGPASRHLADDP